MAEQKVVNNAWIAIWKGVRAFAITMAVLILGGIIQSLTQFQPEPGIQSMIWTAIGGTVIGAIHSLNNWLKNKNAVTVVTKTDDTVVTTTKKPVA